MGLLLAVRAYVGTDDDYEQSLERPRLADLEGGVVTVMENQDEQRPAQQHAAVHMAKELSMDSVMEAQAGLAPHIESDEEEESDETTQLSPEKKPTSCVA